MITCPVCKSRVKKLDVKDKCAICGVPKEEKILHVHHKTFCPTCHANMEHFLGMIKKMRSSEGFSCGWTINHKLIQKWRKG
jgi:hypothetical protein